MLNRKYYKVKKDYCYNLIYRDYNIDSHSTATRLKQTTVIIQHFRLSITRYWSSSNPVYLIIIIMDLVKIFIVFYFMLKILFAIVVLK